MSLLTCQKLLNVVVVLSASLTVNIKINPAIAEEYSISPDGDTTYTLDFSNGRNLTTHQLMVNLMRQKPCAHK